MFDQHSRRNYFRTAQLILIPCAFTAAARQDDDSYKHTRAQKQNKYHTQTRC